jgi:hypothetical protein
LGCLDHVVGRWRIASSAPPYRQTIGSKAGPAFR